MIPKWSIFWSKVFFVTNLVLAVLLLCMSAPLSKVLAQSIFAVLMGAYVLWAERYNRKMRKVMEFKGYARIIKKYRKGGDSA